MGGNEVTEEEIRRRKKREKYERKVKSMRNGNKQQKEKMVR